MTPYLVGALIVAWLCASAWADRQMLLPDEKRPAIPFTLQLAAVAFGGVAAAGGLWYVCLAIATAWLRHGGLWIVVGIALLLLISAPLIPAGLAAFMLLINPLMGLSERSRRRRLQAMRELVSAAVGSDPNVCGVWLNDYHSIRTHSPARQEDLVVVVSGPVTADLERLRATLHARDGGRRPLVLHVASSDDTEAVQRHLEAGYQLYRRDAP